MNAKKRSKTPTQDQPNQKRIAEAVKKYRCGQCSAVGASFTMYEARLLHERYDKGKGEWRTTDSEPLDGWDEPVVVRCGECDEPVLRNGAPLEVEDFGDWLVEITKDYERRQAERAALQEEFAKQQAKGYLRLGEREFYETRLKELE